MAKWKVNISESRCWLIGNSGKLLQEDTEKCAIYPGLYPKSSPGGPQIQWMSLFFH